MNPLLEQAAIFTGALVLMSVSSFVLTVAVEKIGAGLHLSEALLGILTALGADAPEISSSITALAAGKHELGVGVVLGSNIFNLAALLGFSALVAGLVHVRPAGALFNGGIALCTTAIAGLLLLAFVRPWLALGLMLLLVAPYVVLIAFYPTRINELPLPNAVSGFLARAVQQVQKDARKDPAPQPAIADWLLLVPAVYAIVAGSRALVNAAVSLAEQLSIPHSVVGMLGIAALTGIPNAIAALRLAVRGRGSAVESECFNSNTLNLCFGICLPALLVGFGAVSSRTLFALAWLSGMTVIATALLGWRGGLRRAGGAALVLLYVVFAAVMIFWPAITR